MTHISMAPAKDANPGLAGKVLQVHTPIARWPASLLPPVP